MRETNKQPYLRFSEFLLIFPCTCQKGWVRNTCFSHPWTWLFAPNDRTLRCNVIEYGNFSLRLFPVPSDSTRRRNINLQYRQQKKIFKHLGLMSWGLGVIKVSGNASFISDSFDHFASVWIDSSFKSSRSDHVSIILKQGVQPYIYYQLHEKYYRGKQPLNKFHLPPWDCNISVKRLKTCSLNLKIFV